MKIIDNNFFDFLNFIFKNQNKDPKGYKPPLFLLNRWISMANPIYSKIINLTTNKWHPLIDDFDYKIFYKVILPKHYKKINYIKKKDKVDNNIDDIDMANFMECSQREINLFKSTIEEIKYACK